MIGPACAVAPTDKKRVAVAANASSDDVSFLRIEASPDSGTTFGGCNIRTHSRAVCPLFGGPLFDRQSFN